VPAGGGRDLVEQVLQVEPADRHAGVLVREDRQVRPEPFAVQVVGQGAEVVEDVDHDVEVAVQRRHQHRAEP